VPRAICSRRRGRPPATPSLASWVVIPLELAPPVPDHDALAALALAPPLQVRARDVPGRRREACDARWRIPPAISLPAQHSATTPRTLAKRSQSAV